MTTYRYLGDKLTRPDLVGMACDPVRRADGKCVRGRNGSMLVVDVAGCRHVVLGRRLRKSVQP
jgi:hypothetical protein